MAGRERSENHYKFIDLLAEGEDVFSERIRSVNAHGRRASKYTVVFESGDRVRVPASLVNRQPETAYLWVKTARNKRKQRG